MSSQFIYLVTDFVVRAVFKAYFQAKTSGVKSPGENPEVNRQGLPDQPEAFLSVVKAS